MGIKLVYPSQRLARFTAATVAVVLLLFLGAHTWVQPVDFHYGSPIQATTSRHRPPQETSAAANDMFDFPPIESEAIRSVCDETEWDAGTGIEVIFTCDNSIGGVGNVRNSVLNCVRYAMLAGGSLVMPSIVARDDSDISGIRTGERRDMAYLFDVGHFVESLRLSCPQLRLYNSTNDATKAIGLPTTFTMGFFPELLDEIKMTKSSGIALLTHPERWKKKLYEWLGEADTSMGPTGRQTKGPFVLELGRSYLSFPVSFDPDDFVASFGNILKFRADTRQLATTTLRRMAERFNFESTLRKGVAAAGTSLPSAENPGVLENAYFGAHLRVEKDAMFYWDPNGDYWGWTKYDKQTAAYTEQATKANLSLIYVASGETEHVERFRNESATRGITVINKQDVLGKDVEKLDRLKWDQQALVDFLVMLRASQFGGMSHSSFAWNVALKRHLHVKDAANKSHLDGPQMLSDELSQVYGKPKEFAEYASCMWP